MLAQFFSKQKSKKKKSGCFSPYFGCQGINNPKLNIQIATHKSFGFSSKFSKNSGYQLIFSDNDFLKIHLLCFVMIAKALVKADKIYFWSFILM